MTEEGCGLEDVVVRARRFFIRPPKINRILTFVCYLYREVGVFRKILPESGSAGNRTRWRILSIQVLPGEVKGYLAPQK